jgi:hypothetical protein
LLVEPTTIPVRVSGATFRVTFAATDPAATFECADGEARVFAACDAGGGEASAWVFNDLVHGRGYALKVRARAADGRVDGSPLVVSFVADRSGDPGGVTIPDSPDELPGVSEPGGSPSRTLQAGSFYGLRVPTDFFVTSFGTTKNYNGALRLMRILGRPDLTNFTDAGTCTRDYEREVDGPGHALYCDATPTVSEFERDYPFSSVPHNHVETVRMGPSGATERLMVAAFDGSPDDAEGRIGLDGLCSSGQGGVSSVALVPSFYDGAALTVPMTWCRGTDPHGRWWWFGMAKAQLGSAPAGPRLIILYGAAADGGLYSGPQFAAAAQRRIAPDLVPLAPVTP